MRQRLVFLLLALICISSQTFTQITWSEITPDNSGPAARQFHSVVYDAAASKMIVFGGRGAGLELFHDLWVLENPNALSGTPHWTHLTPGNPPPARWMHNATYDSVHKVMIVFGGQDDGGACLNDVWALTNADTTTPTWTQLNPNDTAPGERAPFLSAYSETLNRSRKHSA